MHSTSVIIPVRNGSNFLTDAIASALAQLGAEDRVIVVWDDSTDQTQNIVAGVTNPRVHVLKGLGRGVSGARNVGLAEAKSQFVAFLDHDDLWPSDRHRMMVQAMADDPKIDAIFGRMRVRLEPGATPWPWIMDLDGRHVPGPNLGTALFRSSVLRQISGFDESLRFGEDTDYFERLREAGMRYSLCDIDGLIYRRHADNCTNDQRAVQNSVFDLIKRKMARSKSSRLRGSQQNA